MIRSIEIKNLRGIQEGKLDDLTPLTILVGPNGCGKSTILDALLIGANPIPEVNQAFIRRPGLNDRERWLSWKGKREIAIEIAVATYERGIRQTRLSVPQPSIPQTGFQISIEQTNIAETIKVELGQKNSGSLSPLIGVPSLKLLEGNVKGNIPNLPQLLTEVLVQGSEETVNSLVKELIPNATGLRILVDSSNAPLVHLQFSDHAVPVAVTGDGLQTLLRLSLELLAFPGGVVLFEEPEVHQHPRAIYQSGRAIFAAVRRGIQVIIATHSIDLIDSLLAEVKSDEELARISVFRLALQEGCLRSSRLTGSEAISLRTTIEEDLR
ncbi:MAG TPA: AAA family ATPase [Chthonomonadaceae bacterium]|nr:AAA family ATPase [Chthonomonadaceae bacterium]